VAQGREKEKDPVEKRRLFRMVGKRSRRLLLLALIIAAQPTRLSLIVGLSIAAASELLIVLCYGLFTRKGDERERLVTTGPFAFMRHPVYFGYMVGGVGFTVAAGIKSLPIILGVIYLAIVIPNYLFRIRREETALSEQFGEEYEEYRKRVRWRLVPSPLSGLLHGGFRISWSARLALENRAIAKTGKALLWMLLFIAKWAVLSKWFRKDTFSPWTHRDLHWFLLVFTISILIMVFVPRIRRR
jgi:protein-S-isoprenylcysteine O-methyltransferase Ste14